MTPPALHLDFIKLKNSSDAVARRELLSSASDLGSVPGVLAIRAIDATETAPFDLVTLFLLESAAAIEPFGTDERYTRFLQGTVAPVLQGLDGADVSLDAPAGDRLPYVACLAIAAPTETYDWEVRERLQAWLTALECAGWGVAGLAVGEPLRFRGIALAAAAVPFSIEQPSSPGSVVVCGELRELA